MLTKLQSANPMLAGQLAELQGLSPNEVAEKLNANGEIIRAILKWIKENPEFLAFILSLFGINVPVSEDE